MMLVRTPWEFYFVRLLLGIAEAGFLPRHDLLPHAVVPGPREGARSEPLLYFASAQLHSDGLAGRLVDGAEWDDGADGMAVAVSRGGDSTHSVQCCNFARTAGRPGASRWLTKTEKAWLTRQLDADGAQAHLGHEAGVLRALLSPKVWIIGLFFLSALTAATLTRFQRRPFCRARRDGA